jgi:signal transduction histidine kinase
MKYFAFLTWAATLFFPCHAEGLLRTAADLMRYIDGEPDAPADFVITATVTHVRSKGLIGTVGHNLVYVKDHSGTARIADDRNPPPKPGDVLAATGQISFCPVGNASLFTNNAISVIGHVEPPPPEKIPLPKLNPHFHHLRKIVTEGTVVDVIHDEISSNTVFLLLKDGTVQYPLALIKDESFEPLRYLDARIRACGIFYRRVSGYRIYSGPYIEPDDSSCISILTPPPADPFAAPPIQHYPVLTPQEVDNLPRSSETGRVLATWNGNKFVMQTPKGKIIVVKMLDGVPPPVNGDAVKVVGFPTTDLFRINLSRAITRPEPVLGPIGAESPESVDLEHLIMDGNRPSPDAVRFYHGRTIRYRGTVKDTNDGGTASPNRLHLQTGSATTTVNAGASGLDLGKIPVGSEVEVTGVCVLEGESWTSERIFPHLRGFMLVLRTASDLVVVRNPPWWTIGRLTAAIAILVAGLFAIVLWNRYLNRLVNRRGHELMREKMKKESAQLKTGERTRLAVELHDSLSQSLEGVACQVAATRTIMKTSHDAAESCLDTAERMLDSCRLELKRCLFDLRGNALEAKDLSDAIRTTLVPICDGVDLDVRFDIRRSHFDDTTVHATLCIIRELVSNAIRHGRATTICVAGEYYDGTLAFSVSDNGCGFDPSATPGPSQGHFGLEGIRERAERLDGSVKVESETGKGTKINVKLKVKS